MIPGTVRQNIFFLKKVKVMSSYSSEGGDWDSDCVAASAWLQNTPCHTWAPAKEEKNQLTVSFIGNE